MRIKEEFAKKEKKLKIIFLIITLTLIIIWISIYFLQQKNFKNLLREERTHGIFNLKMIQNNIHDVVFSKNIIKSLIISRSKNLIEQALNLDNIYILDSLRKQFEIDQFFIIDNSSVINTALPEDAILDINISSVPSSGEYILIESENNLLYLTKYNKGKYFIAGIKQELINEIIKPLQLSSLFQTINNQIIRTLHDSSKTNHINYIVIQDRDGIIAATENLKKIEAIESDNFLQEIIKSDKPNARIYNHQNKKYFETVLPGKLFSNSVIRFGVDFSRIAEFKEKQIIMFVIYSLIFIFLFLSEYLFYRYYKKANHYQKELAMKKHLAEIGKLGGEVAHEIKNPLNAIYMTLQQLKINRDSQSKQDFDKSVELIYDEIDRLNNIVQKFLYFSRPTQLSYSKVKVKDFLKKILNLFSEQCHKQKIKCTIKSDRDLEWYFDIEAMRIAITNLLKNAIESFSEKSSQNRNKEIFIDYRANKGTLIITISDNGEGISSKNMENIWNFYFTTKKSGSGIGLPTVKKIIEEHYGKIKVISKPGECTTVEIYLPFRRK